MFFFFKQKTAYEMRISDWSSDVCSSDLVHINLSAIAVDYLADFNDIFLEHTVGRGISHHQRSQVTGLGGSLVFQIGQVYISMFITADHHNFHSCNGSAGGIGPVS